jgi:NAD(P)-dependent dehydrogenase (short-subunit alcohol dehydrogenase family)
MEVANEVTNSEEANEMATARTVAIVTGASRGAGKGIATALGSHGCIVYVTGRSENEGDAEVSGTIHATAREVTEAGGTGIAVRCDHADDDQVRALVERVIAEQGRIDILVNNAAWQGHVLSAPGQFWEKSLEVSKMIDVGARSGFVASWFAAPHMVKQEKGLILFTSSPGSMHYCMGPSYGAHKAAVDKMAFDMGIDFADAGANVAAVSVWMGSLTTERLFGMMEAMPDLRKHLEGTLESSGYTGHVAWAMFNDPEMFAKLTAGP